ncbi:uncharacterized protein TRIREDRAFT_112400 [Trichoderma reesei QM6a]|uniref:Predicted protein n=2 Tax=Hypocrea jecorina TaxID=51453 RepID=G0RWZ1_HYPJQ|nr:uncharacterized protein TRIREDRAFT_112400 [Trichoderma reesei QM6a]EGR44329.1 predicted protein [Trichoderma reesei QM6a]ETR96965.1 hypothetical protein M419DRAFT_92858 [Trichoderma reesei RUT C-30]
MAGLKMVFGGIWALAWFWMNRRCPRHTRDDRGDEAGSSLTRPPRLDPQLGPNLRLSRPGPDRRIQRRGATAAVWTAEAGRRVRGRVVPPGGPELPDSVGPGTYPPVEPMGKTMNDSTADTWFVY